LTRQRERKKEKDKQTKRSLPKREEVHSLALVSVLFCLDAKKGLRERETSVKGKEK